MFFKFDKELLSVSNELENFSCTSVNEEQFSMVKYNADYKPVEKIVWENKNTVADSKIILKENWKYSGEYIFSTKEDLKNKKTMKFDTARIFFRFMLWNIVIFKIQSQQRKILCQK